MKCFISSVCYGKDQEYDVAGTFDLDSLIESIEHLSTEYDAYAFKIFVTAFNTDAYSRPWKSPHFIVYCHFIEDPTEETSGHYRYSVEEEDEELLDLEELRKRFDYYFP